MSTTLVEKLRLGLGTCLPDRIVTNSELAGRLDTTDEWIRTRTGMKERHYAAPDEATSDLALCAARSALEDAGVAATSVRCVIIATATPDYPVPATAPMVADRLGCGPVAAFDIAAGCSGFVYGLAVASSMAPLFASEPVLLVGAEILTRMVDQKDRRTAVLFGDGAGALVLGGTSPIRCESFDLGSEGSQEELLKVRAGGSRHPASPTTVAAGDHHLSMNGSAVYRMAVARMEASARKSLATAGLEVGDVGLVIAHQANSRIVSALAERLGLTPAQVVDTVDRHGNTSAASIPLALDVARREGRIGSSTTVLVTSFGAGLTWGSCLLTLGKE